MSLQSIDTDILHHLDKADTKPGLVSIRVSANLGVPYSVLLYQRLLGRPFAGHHDSISELLGNVIENVIENALTQAGISSRKIGRAEHLAGFDQASDFVVPNTFNPRIVIEPQFWIRSRGACDAGDGVGDADVANFGLGLCQGVSRQA